MEIKRRKCSTVRVGDLVIGGDAPISIQSMTNTDTHDFEATRAQIVALAAAGCDVVRLTVPDMEAVGVLARLKNEALGVPLVADIHFDHRLAVAAAEVGVDKIRINPGNIGDEASVRDVVNACHRHAVPIRIGVNGGSLENHNLAKHGAPTPEALSESALYHVSLLEKYDSHDIVISIKASDVPTMIGAVRLLADRCTYPLHLGVTEAGAGESARAKSAIGIGSLLVDGIGDTVRVSLTSDPVEEIAAAKSILRAIGAAGHTGLNIVSCPTCGRTKINLIDLVARFEAAAKKEGLMDMPLRVALMGCAVNGPGEAREADIGICGGKGEALLIKRGEIVEKIKEDQVIDCLIAEIKKIKEG